MAITIASRKQNGSSVTSEESEPKRQISVKSRKAKGRILQNTVAGVLHDTYPFLTVGKDQDIQGREMGQSGTDIRLSTKARKFIPFDIECKAVERFDIWGSLKQCEDNTGKGRIPLLVFKRNRSKIYCCLELKDLLFVMGD